MAAGAWQFYDEGLEDILDGTVDLDTDTIKCQLHTSSYSPADTDTTLSNEVANGAGYTTGGVTLTTITVTNSSGTVTIDCTSPDPIRWTASGGDITAKYAVIIKSGTTQPLLYCDLDSGGGSLTATDGNNFDISINASGISTFAQA